MSIDRAEMMMSKRRSRRSFGEGVVRVFAVVSARELAEAHGGNGGATASLLLRSVEAMEEQSARASRQAAVCFPFQDGQRAAQSGRAKRVADTRRPVSVAGRP